MKNGCRKSCIMILYNLCARFYLFAAGVSSSRKTIDYDYTPYLGPNYKEGMADTKKTSTLVCNHVSWLDSMVLML